MAVTFTYDFAIDVNISRVRLKVADTNPDQPIFGDDEIQQALWLESSQAQNPRARQVYSYNNAAAMLLESIAANKARLAAIAQALDIQLDASRASKELRALAQQLRQREDDSPAFAIAEMANTAFAERELMWKQLLRAA